MNTFKETYREAFGKNQLDEYIKDEYISKFELLTEELLRVNEYMNLTALTQTDDIITKHYIDSLAIQAYIPKGARLIDVGTGGGFPALPLAIIRPDIKITALDSTEKKLKFVEQTAKLLSLDNVEIKCGRAEDLGKDAVYRERFDMATARAVARLNVLSELCLPLVKKGGKFISLKGALAEDEISHSQKAFAQLGGEMTENIQTDLLCREGLQKRYVVIVQKTNVTPKKYPRNYAQISKNPL